jgi:hypothetical protein
VSDRSDLPGDMPNLPWNRRSIALPPEERSFEALLSGAQLPADAPTDAHLVADLVEALRAPARADEMGRFGVASGAYRERFTTSPRHGRNLRWRPALLGSFATAKLATALAAAAVALGGLGAAAYAGTLPDSAQDVAHTLIGAPSGHGKGHGKGHDKVKNGTETGGPVGPDATGPAAYGLCNAFEHAKVHGKSIDKSVAFGNLADAAGGVDKIAQYCAGVSRPSSSAEPEETGEPNAPAPKASHATGKPSTESSTSPSPSHGKPSSVPTPSHPAPTSP